MFDEGMFALDFLHYIQSASLFEFTANQYYSVSMFSNKPPFRLLHSHPQSDTLNPFEISNGQFFGNGTTNRVDNTSEASDAAGNHPAKHSDTTNTTRNRSPFDEQLANNRQLYNCLTQPSSEENKLELADLRRQVVYLQVFARFVCIPFPPLERYSYECFERKI